MGIGKNPDRDALEQSLQNYLDKWTLCNPQLITTTATSRIYAVTFSEARVILKMLTPAGEKDEKNGAIALRCFDGHGAVTLLKEDKGAHLLEYAEGDSLTSLVKMGKDQEATAIIGDMLNALHASYRGSMPEGITPLRTWFRSLFSRAEQEGNVYKRAADVAEKLLASPQEVGLLHGDIHHDNIRQSTRGWLAFDPKGLWGERAYDTANAFCNPLGMETLTANEDRLMTMADILAKKMNIDRARLLSFVFVYAALSASWSLEDHQAPEQALRIAHLAEPHGLRVAG